MLVHGKNSSQYELKMPYAIPKGSRIQFQQEVGLEVAVGEYTVTLGLAEAFPDYYEKRSFLPDAVLNEGLLRLCHIPEADVLIVIPRKEGFPAVLLHHGACNLPGNMQFAFLNVHGKEVNEDSVA